MLHDLRLEGLARFALNRGGSIHPMIVPKELSDENGIMNPSIFIHNGRPLINLRRINYTLFHSEKKRFSHPWGPLMYTHPENDVTLRTDNIICELDDDMNITSHHMVNMVFDKKPVWNFIGLEDCRLFSWDNKLWLCGVRRDHIDDKGRGRMDLSEIVFEDGQWVEKSRETIPAPGDQPGLYDSSYCEKNWMPINDMPWHFVKWTNPTEVVRYDQSTNSTTTAVCDETKTYPFPRDIRGGSQVVRISKDRYIAITHEVDLTPDYHGRKDGQYMHRVVVWDNDWNIVHYTREFSFMGEIRCPHVGTKHKIEFAVGLAFYQGNALISYGLQDNAAFVLKMPQDAFLEFVMKG